jgi:hypothetical protein
LPFGYEVLIGDLGSKTHPDWTNGEVGPQKARLKVFKTSQFWLLLLLLYNLTIFQNYPYRLTEIYSSAHGTDEFVV